MEFKGLEWKRKSRSIVSEKEKVQMIITHVGKRWEENIFIPYLGIRVIGSRKTLKRAMRDMYRIRSNPKFKAMIYRRQKHGNRKERD